MPITPTYPGVYIEEVPSGVRTIVGVATSITAFLGRTERGPINEGVEISNYGEFERTFGGLNVSYPLTYVISDFFLNGGSRAVIVRLFKAAAEEDGGGGDGDGGGDDGDGDGDGDGGGNGAAGANGDANGGRAKLTYQELKLIAANEGAWGDSLRARVESAAGADLAWMPTYNLQAADLFNLMVHDTRTNTTERFLNITVKESPRRVDRVLANSSNLVRLTGNVPTSGPIEISLPGAHPAPTVGQDIWKVDTLSEKVAEDEKGENSANLTTSLDFLGSQQNQTGMYALDKVDLFNLLCIPPDTRDGDLPDGVIAGAAAYCAQRRAVLLVDPPRAWGDNPATAAATVRTEGMAGLGLTGTFTRNAAVYFPRVRQSDPLRDGQSDIFPASGIIAGIIARTDATRGVWKAPAGIEAGINGIQGLQVNLNDAENGQLNPLGFNCLRSFPVIGPVVWGARTARGADQLADEWKYLPVRRTALFIEESLYRGLQWVVFEPNDEPLWAQIRLNVGSFMHDLFRKGAFQGSTPREAYFVRCDKTTTTQSDINQGIVNILVGFAALKPAEFVIVKLQQMAGQIEV
jgi:uncharacterized protein